MSVITSLLNYKKQLTIAIEKNALSINFSTFMLEHCMKWSLIRLNISHIQNVSYKL